MAIGRISAVLRISARRKPLEDGQKMILDVNDAMIDATRPGQPFSKVAEAAECISETRRRGSMSTLGKGRVGHGMGLMSTEPPHVALYEETVCEEGLIVHDRTANHEPKWSLQLRGTPARHENRGRGHHHFSAKHHLHPVLIASIPGISDMAQFKCSAVWACVPTTELVWHCERCGGEIIRSKARSRSDDRISTQPNVRFGDINKRSYTRAQFDVSLARAGRR